MGVTGPCSERTGDSFGVGVERLERGLVAEGRPPAGMRVLVIISGWE